MPFDDRRRSDHKLQSLTLSPLCLRSVSAPIERISTGKGEILEDYRYDEQGQLVAVKRKGEPERLLRYDESGRLMDLDEVRVP